MKYRYLGRSGVLVSEIAYGNWMTHGAHVDDTQAAACVHAALDAGITTFDTADAYADTRAEAVLGAALGGVRREGLVICTKVFFPTGPGPNDRGLSRKHLRESVAGSLRRLRTDYVDVYQAHRFDYHTPLEETMEAFADIVHSGKAHYIGVSEWKPAEIRMAAALARELRIRIVSNQSQYSLLWRVLEGEIQPACDDLGITQIVYSPLAQGVLTGKYTSAGSPAAGTRAAAETAGDAAPPQWASAGVLARAQEAVRGTVSMWLTPQILDRVQQLVPVARQAGLSLAEMALAWVLRNQSVSSAIVGGSRPQQVRQNAAASGVTLDPGLVAAIDAILDPVVERDPGRLPVYEERP